MVARGLLENAPRKLNFSLIKSSKLEVKSLDEKAKLGGPNPRILKKNLISRMEYLQNFKELAVFIMFKYEKSCSCDQIFLLLEAGVHT